MPISLNTTYIMIVIVAAATMTFRHGFMPSRYMEKRRKKGVVTRYPIFFINKKYIQQTITAIIEQRKCLKVRFSRSGRTFLRRLSKIKIVEKKSDRNIAMLGKKPSVNPSRSSLCAQELHWTYEKRAINNNVRIHPTPWLLLNH